MRSILLLSLLLCACSAKKEASQAKGQAEEQTTPPALEGAKVADALDPVERLFAPSGLAVSSGLLSSVPSDARLAIVLGDLSKFSETLQLTRWSQEQRDALAELSKTKIGLDLFDLAGLQDMGIDSSKGLTYYELSADVRASVVGVTDPKALGRALAKSDRVLLISHEGDRATLLETPKRDLEAQRATIESVREETSLARLAPSLTIDSDLAFVLQPAQKLDYLAVALRVSEGRLIFSAQLGGAADWKEQLVSLFGAAHEQAPADELAQALLARGEVKLHIPNLAFEPGLSVADKRARDIERASNAYVLRNANITQGPASLLALAGSVALVATNAEKTKFRGVIGDKDSLTRLLDETARWMAAQSAKLQAIAGLETQLAELNRQSGGAFAELYATSGLGDNDVYGGLLGTQIGEMQGGWAVDMGNTGGGGGGTGEGTIGLGGLGTIGGHGSGGYQRSGITIPRVRMGQVRVEGPLDENIVRRYLRHKVPNFLSCYERELQDDPKLAGTVHVVFEIDAQGAAKVSKASGLKAELDACVVSTIESIVFPRPTANGQVTVRYPLSFEPK